MANIFTNLPRPAAANGSGAAVDTSGCGADKYIVVDGSWTLPDRPPTVTIEINNDATPNGTWAPLCSFVGNGKKAIQCAARWMRATVSNYRGGTNPLVNFGSTDDPASFVTPAVPAAEGVGAATDITALPEIKTVTIGDAFTGCVILEYSEDAGGVDWAELPAMWAPGTMTFPLIANWIRVRRQGIPTAVTPGTPIVNLGGVAPAGGAGGATDGVNVEYQGVPVLTPALTLNFVGEESVTDGGGDTAEIKTGIALFQGSSVVPNPPYTPVVGPPATKIWCAGSDERSIGIDLEDLGEAGDDNAGMSIGLGQDLVANTAGQPAVSIPINKWAVGLVNESGAESVADFELGAPTGVVTEITIINESNASTKAVAVAVTDFVGGPSTFTGSDPGDTVTFIARGGFWYLKANNQFVQS